MRLGSKGQICVCVCVCVYVHIEELCVSLMKEAVTVPEALEICLVLRWLITHGDFFVELRLSL